MIQIVRVIVISIVIFLPLFASEIPVRSIFDLRNLFAQTLEKNITIFPHYQFSLDLHSFALHKNAFFLRQYLAGSKLESELGLLQVGNSITILTDADLDFGLGEVPGNVVFTLLNTSVHLAPVLRVSLKNIKLSMSLNHYCFHDIDSKLFPVIYYNTVNVNLASSNFQESDYWKEIGKGIGWIPCKNIAWDFKINYYLKDFFGIVSPGKLNGYNDRITDVNFKGKYGLLTNRMFSFALTGDELLGMQKSTEENNFASVYWRANIGGELYLHGKNEGVSLYAKYFRDDMPMVEMLPRFSKDKLLEFGLRFFK